MRPIIWYLVLVGLPFVSLLGILRLGEGLKPPRATHGEFAASFESSGAETCASVFDERLSISQSGRRLETTLGPIVFKGRIDGDTLRVAAPLPAGCLTADSVALVAALEGTAAELRLAGTIRFPGCDSCVAVPLHAIRVSARPRDARG